MINKEIVKNLFHFDGNSMFDTKNIFKESSTYNGELPNLYLGDFDADTSIYSYYDFSGVLKIFKVIDLDGLFEHIREFIQSATEIGITTDYACTLSRKSARLYFAAMQYINSKGLTKNNTIARQYEFDNGNAKKAYIEICEYPSAGYITLSFCRCSISKKTINAHTVSECFSIIDEYICLNAKYVVLDMLDKCFAEDEHHSFVHSVSEFKSVLQDNIDNILK